MKALPIALLLALALASPVNAAGTWSDSGIQWHTNQPFTLNVTDYTTGAWSAMVRQSAADWSASSTANVVVGGRGGRIQVSIANGTFPSGPCGWTQVSLSNGYIKTATIYLNDLCSPASWQLVVCQELGHALGMPDHRLDVPPAPSCMAPANYGPQPIQDDFDELASLYP